MEIVIVFKDGKQTSVDCGCGEIDEFKEWLKNGTSRAYEIKNQIIMAINVNYAYEPRRSF